MPRVRKPQVASFSPRLLEVWKQALQRKIKIPAKNRQDATRLRFRLYELRTAMKEEQHPFYSSAVRVTLRIIEEVLDDQRRWFVVAEHADTAFDDQLARAGIDDPSAEPPSLEELLEISDEDRAILKPEVPENK